jgi:thioredoxin 1
LTADLFIRALWALLIAGGLVGIYWAVNWVIVARASSKRLGLEDIRPGVPAILYFTTPTCVPCKTIQRPALARLQEQMMDSLQVIEIDAAARPELADYWGVLSVPTTFIIDARGRPRRVNHGVSSAEKLQRQVEEVDGRPIAFQTLRTLLRKYQKKRNYS